MTKSKKAVVNCVNDTLNENRVVEKMVKQVIGGGEKISEEGQTILSSYMSSVRGLNNLLGETSEDPIIINGRETKDLIDKATRVPKADNCQKVDSDSSETGSHKCPKCQKSFTNEHYLKQHSDTCKDKKKTHKKKFTCKYCDREINSEYNLKMHVQQKHKIIDKSTSGESSDTPTKGNHSEHNKTEKESSAKNNGQDKTKNGSESGSPKSKHDINNKQDAQKTKSNKNPSDIEKEKEPSNQKFDCNIFGKLCDSKKLYIERKKTCLPPLFEPEKSVPCELCTEKLFNIGALNKHKEYCHKE